MIKYTKTHWGEGIYMSFVPRYAQIRNLLNEDAVFSVPRYQRKYVWSNLEWKNLLEDVIIVVNKNNSVSDEKVTHFIGSFIFEKNGTTWEIVDGQQRLSTISILLASISKKIRLLGDIASSDGVTKYLFHTDSHSEKKPRIINGSDLYSLFIAKYFNSDNSISSLSDLIRVENITIKKADINFQNSINYYDNYLQTLLDAKIDILEKKKFLEDLKTVILDLDVIEITASDKNSGYIIFQVLNSRGKPLETFELLKNYIFTYQKIVNGSDSANIIWEEILSNTELENVSNSSIDRFLTNYIVHKYGKVSKRAEFDTIIENTPKTKVKELLDDLKEKSKMYKRICTGQGFSNANINYVLNFLNKFKNTQFRPVLLSLFEKLGGNSDGIVKLEKILISIKNFISIYVVIMKEKTNKLEKIIYRYAKELHDNYTDVLCKSFLEELYNQLPSKDIFSAKFKQLAYSKDKSWYPDINVNYKKEINHVLTELEIYDTSSDDRIPSKFTLEHVKDDSLKGSACYIGNIIPLSSRDNKATNGKDYSQKIKIYERSSYITPRNIKTKLEANFQSKADYWNDHYIDGNTTRLANHFYDSIWVNKF
jgi:uncharacterized protein with ParB-like and HNH nuclease domain